MQPGRDRELDRELRDLGPHVEYPSTPDLAGSVRSRLETEAGGSGSPARSGPQLWWVAAAALILLVAVPAFSLAIHGLGGGMAGSGAVGSGGQASGDRPAAVDEPRTGPTFQVEEDEAVPGAASSSAGALAASAGTGAGSAQDGAFGEGLGLGEKIPLREARARSEAPILLPRTPKLGEPDEVYARGDGPGFVSVYGARSGMRAPEDTAVALILTQTPGGVGKAYLPGGTVRGTDLEAVGVDGWEGYWIPPSANSPEVDRSAGLLAGVLLWEQDGQALRLEADLPKKEAVRIAESVR